MQASRSRWVLVIGLLAVTALTLVAVAARSRGTAGQIKWLASGRDGLDSIELAYEEQASGNIAFATSYKIETTGTIVHFSCTNCAVHDVVFRAPESEIRDIINRFSEGGFFNERRVPPEPRMTHTGWRRLSYRDNRVVHEVRWMLNPTGRTVEDLRARLVAIARVQYFLETPAYEVIQSLLDQGNWWAMPESLESVALNHDRLAVQLLLKRNRDRDIEITESVLLAAARGGDPDTVEMILAKLDPRRRTEAVGLMLVAAATTHSTDTGLVKWLIAQPGAAEYKADALDAATRMKNDAVAQVLR